MHVWNLSFGDREIERNNTRLMESKNQNNYDQPQMLLSEEEEKKGENGEEDDLSVYQRID